MVLAEWGGRSHGAVRARAPTQRLRIKSLGAAGQGGKVMFSKGTKCEANGRKREDGARANEHLGDMLIRITNLSIWLVLACLSSLWLACGSAGHRRASTDGTAQTSAASVGGTSADPPLARGMNLGNALDAPNEGDWGVTLSERYFDA